MPSSESPPTPPRPRRPRPPRRRRRRGPSSPNAAAPSWFCGDASAPAARSSGPRSSSVSVSIESASTIVSPMRIADERRTGVPVRGAAVRVVRPPRTRSRSGAAPTRRGRAGASDCLSGTSVMERSSSPSAATRRPLRAPASTLAIVVISMNWSATSTRSLLVFARKLTTSTRTPMSCTARIAGAKSPSPEMTTAMSSFGARRTRSTTSSMSRFALKRPSPYLRTSLLTTL